MQVLYKELNTLKYTLGGIQTFVEVISSAVIQQPQQPIVLVLQAVPSDITRRIQTNHISRNTTKSCNPSHALANDCLTEGFVDSFATQNLL